MRKPTRKENKKLKCYRKRETKQQEKNERRKCFKHEHLCGVQRATLRGSSYYGLDGRSLPTKARLVRTQFGGTLSLFCNTLEHDGEQEDKEP